MSGSQPPFNAKNRSGSLMGLEVDLGEMLANALGVSPKFVEKPFPELLSALKAGEVDIVMSGMGITPERTLEVTFVGPYMMSGKSILTRSSLLARAEGTGDLDQSDITLAALGNSTSQQFIEEFVPHATFVATQDYDSAVQKVISGEVDAMVADMPACLLSVLRYPDQNLATLRQPLSIEPIGIAMPSNDPQLKNVIEN